MIEIITIGAMGLVFTWWLYAQWRSRKRAEAGRCPRCGVRLDTVESRMVQINDTGGTVYRMCIPCADRTRFGWLYWTIALAVLVLLAVVAVQFGWLPNE